MYVQSPLFSLHKSTVVSEAFLVIVTFAVWWDGYVEVLEIYTVKRVL